MASGSSVPMRFAAAGASGLVVHAPVPDVTPAWLPRTKGATLGCPCRPEFRAHVSIEQAAAQGVEALRYSGQAHVIPVRVAAEDAVTAYAVALLLVLPGETQPRLLHAAHLQHLAINGVPVAPEALGVVEARVHPAVAKTSDGASAQAAEEAALQRAFPMQGAMDTATQRSLPAEVRILRIAAAASTTWHPTAGLQDDAPEAATAPAPVFDFQLLEWHPALRMPSVDASLGPGGAATTAGSGDGSSSSGDGEFPTWLFGILVGGGLFLALLGIVLAYRRRAARLTATAAQAEQGALAQRLRLPVSQLQGAVPPPQP